MAHFIGEPRYFQDCKPGDLIRVGHRGGARFAFAICGTANGLADRAIILDLTDGAPLTRLDGGELVICYGRNYRIQEGHTSTALVGSSQPMPGRIVWGIGKTGPEAHLMVTGERGLGFVNLDTGHISAPSGRPGFDIAHWTVLLTFPDGSDPLVVFEATGKAT